MTEKEIWVPIKTLEEKYNISSFGRVKSLSRKVGNGKGYFIKSSILNPSEDRDGYKCVGLSVGKRMNKTFRVHKLVAEHFIENKKGIVCHKDGNNHNNNFKNLYFGTVLSNTVDKYKHGSTKLSINEVKAIYKSKMLQKRLAKIYGVKASYISRIKTGARASHITTIL